MKLYANSDELGYFESVRDGTKEQYSSRILFPFLYEYTEQVLHEFSVPYFSDELRLYKISLILTLAGIGLAFQWYLELWFSEGPAFSGTLFLFLVIHYTYMFGGHIDSLFNLLLFIVCASLIVRKINWLLYIIIPLGALNRETILFVPFLYFLAEYSDQNKWNACWKSITLFLSGFLIYGIIRLLRVGFDSSGYSDLFFWNFACHHCNLTLFFMFHLFWILAFIGLSQKPFILQRWAISIPFFIVVHYHLGSVREVRMFLPLAVIIIPLALWVLFPGDNR
jgi:hypothetical protein